MNYSFDINIAKEYGVNEAIMIQNFLFWIIKNKANGKNQFDGHTWTFNSVNAYSQLFPFWSAKQVRTILLSLIEKEVLIKGNYNKKGYDRTTWYAFKSENKFLSLYQNGKSILPNGQMDVPERKNEFAQMGQPIPDINKDNKQDKKPDDLFISFWNIYDKKIDRPKCEKKWLKLSDNDKKAILAYVPNYTKSTPEKKYRKHPATFLNNRSWENEIINNNKTPIGDTKLRASLVGYGMPENLADKAVEICKNEGLTINDINRDTARGIYKKALK